MWSRRTEDRANPSLWTSQATGFMHQRPVTTRSPRRCAVLPEAIERARPWTAASDHRQARQLCRGAPDRDAGGDPQHSAVRKQSSGGLASTDAATRAPDATVQVGRTRATLLIGARSRAEPLSCGAPSAPGCSPPFTENAIVPCLGCGDVCLLNNNGHRVFEGSLRPLLVNLTVSMILLPVGVAR